jgi:hypothetical protein
LPILVLEDRRIEGYMYIYSCAVYLGIKSMYIIYKMPISREMDDIIKRLQISDNEIVDWKKYDICRKLYLKEKIEFEDCNHMRNLSEKRKNDLLEYIYVIQKNRNI